MHTVGHGNSRPVWMWSGLLWMCFSGTSSSLIACRHRSELRRLKQSCAVRVKRHKKPGSLYQSADDPFQALPFCVEEEKPQLCLRLQTLTESSCVAHTVTQCLKQIGSPWSHTSPHLSLSSSHPPQITHPSLSSGMVGDPCCKCTTALNEWWVFFSILLQQVELCQRRLVLKEALHSSFFLTSSTTR